ncbi:MAG TPA: Gfo/Idh/MocA family oxidoreductase [Candidatus Saccharimonadales bacterium]|nr:Gfo/Idh/MocA family oxidoreductase [Candidatus Saccharimonadales bacterium]
MPALASMPRRRFLGRALAVGSGAVLAGSARPLAALEPPPWRAAIIGHTRRGDYGHDLDVVFNDHPGIELVGLADPDETGRSRAAERSHAWRTYADYREMLAKEKPQLVVVGPRHTDQHHEMTSAALRSGAHVLTEKPFTQTLAQGDALLAQAEGAGLRTAVAHQARLSPSILHLQRRLQDGWIGSLRQMRAWGKQDARAGGEDLIVLGTHLFDLMKLFGGQVEWCSARIRSQGHEATRADIRQPTEAIGPVLGDDIEAQFEFAGGISATFTSRAALRQTLGPWGLMLMGDKGTVRVLMDIAPRIFVGKSGAWEAGGSTERWEPLAGDPMQDSPASERGFPAANRRVLDDWLAAIRDRREPACSGRRGLEAVEIAMAVFAAGLSGDRIRFPLAQRTHPLA